MLVWSGCSDVSRSRFIDYQESLKDFKEWVEKFQDPLTFRVTDKKESLPLFIPAEFPDMMPVRRCAANVLRIHMLVVDVDKGSAEDFNRVFARVGQYGHVVYSSFSHNPDGQWKFRIIVKLSRPVDITEWKAFFPRALSHLGLLEIADMKCADAAHMFYTPGGPDPAKYVCEAEDGPGLDVDGVLSLPLPESVKEQKQEGYTEVLPEYERGEISVGLRDYWEGLLQHLYQDIYDRPFPGAIYDLKSHRVFYLARGCPHIMDPERLRRMVKNALKARYKNAGEEGAALQEKAFAQVDAAIEEGMAKPWYPPLINEVPVRPFTEYGLAERFVDRHQADVRFEPTWDAWITWNQKHWDQVAGDMLVQEKMKDTVRAVADEAGPHYAEYWIAKELYEQTRNDANASEELKAKAEFDYEEKKELIEGIRSFALKSETARKTNAAVSLAKSQPSVLSSFSLFNRNPWLLNFQNGTLNLRTGELRPHRREDYISRVIPCDFDPKALCPRFDRFLSQCMLDNQHLSDFLWRVLGYSAVGVTDEQKMFLCHGDGANGKSTFLKLMLDLFGQGGTGYGFAANSSNLLTHKGQDKHETWRMDMHGKRFVAALEVDEGRSLAESLVKELTGSDTITGRKMRQDNWSYTPEFTLWMAANHLPHIRGTDEGIWRRIVVVEWNASFKEAPDKDLPRKLLQEAPGIWARIAREAKAWVREGLVIPKEVMASTTQYRQEQDPLKDFMERWCVIEKDGQVERTALWAAYEEYCNDTKTHTFHERKRFYAAVEKQYPLKTIDGYRYFAGARLKTPKERLESMPRSILSRAQAPENEKPN